PPQTVRAPAPVNRGVRGRSPTGTRRTAHASNLRSDSQTHCRTPRDGPLHGHSPAGPPAGLSGRVPGVLVAATGNREGLVQPLYTASRRDLERKADAGGSRPGGRGSDGAPAEVPQAGASQRAARRL